MRTRSFTKAFGSKAHVPFRNAGRAVRARGGPMAWALAVAVLVNLWLPAVWIHRHWDEVVREVARIYPMNSSSQAWQGLGTVTRALTSSAAVYLPGPGLLWLAAPVQAQGQLPEANRPSMNARLADLTANVPRVLEEVADAAIAAEGRLQDAVEGLVLGRDAPTGGAIPLIPGAKITEPSHKDTEPEPQSSRIMPPGPSQVWPWGASIPGADAARALWSRLTGAKTVPVAGMASQAARRLARAVQAGRRAQAASSPSPSPSPAPSYPGEVLVFEDDFSSGALDTAVWKPEISLGGFGNWEFQVYTHNVSNRKVKGGQLYLQPRLTSEMLGQEAVEGTVPATMDIWGGEPANLCTAPNWYGCMRSSSTDNVINPVSSARVRTAESFALRYGRVEVRAKLPRGDWLWPAIWLLPRHQAYGPWPASGEIDVMESRGNAPDYPSGGRDTFGSTLHWGPSPEANQWSRTHRSYQWKGPGDLSDDFHVYGLLWGPDRLLTYLDSPSQVVLDVPFTEAGGMWEKGGLQNSNINNPWQDAGTAAAPFDQEFYLIMNVAVGGTAGGAQGYFPDGQGGKPWSNVGPSPMKAFWAARETWLPSWGWVQQAGAAGGVGWAPGPDAARSAMVVDWVRVWQPAGSHAPASDPLPGPDQAPSLPTMDKATRVKAAAQLKRYASIWPPSWGLRPLVLRMSQGPNATRRLLVEGDTPCAVTLDVTARVQPPCTDVQVTVDQ